MLSTYETVEPVKPTQPDVVFNLPSAHVEPTHLRSTHFPWAGLETNQKPENPAPGQCGSYLSSEKKLFTCLLMFEISATGLHPLIHMFLQQPGDRRETWCT